jgi:hypothetical protein
MTTKEKFIKEQKTERTVKLKTVIVAIAFVLVAIGGTVLGWLGRSNFDSSIRATVTSQVQELTVKE